MPGKKFAQVQMIYFTSLSSNFQDTHEIKMKKIEQYEQQID